MIHASVFLIMRWLHIGSAALIVGGLTLLILSVAPVQALTRNEALDLSIKRVEARYRWALMASVLGLVISGVYQWVIFGQLYQAHTVLLVLLSFKVLIATAMFAMLWAFQVDSMVGPDAKAWRWVNLILAVSVLPLAGLVRYIRLDVAGQAVQ